jgi:hypothetical protein
LILLKNKIRHIILPEDILQKEEEILAQQKSLEKIRTKLQRQWLEKQQEELFAPGNADKSEYVDKKGSPMNLSKTFAPKQQTPSKKKKPAIIVVEEAPVAAAPEQKRQPTTKGPKVIKLGNVGKLATPVTDYPSCVPIVFSPLRSFI